RKLLILLAVVFLSFSLKAYAQDADGEKYGPHLECEMCHKEADPEDDPFIFKFKPNTTDINPRTGKPLPGTSAICLGCHGNDTTSDIEAPYIDLSRSHPVGVVSEKVKLPYDAVGFEGDQENISCLSCHDHHPDNPNPKYLRWPAGEEGDTIGEFCIHCHKDKGTHDEFDNSHGDCLMCHSIHDGEKEVIFRNKQNRKTVNPHTGKPFNRVASLCMSCHARKPGGKGILPLNMEHSHPIDIKPKKVKLPPEAKGFPGEEEKITCTSCHNQHPANKNFKYLRWPTKSSFYMSVVCAKCHQDKADPTGKGEGAHGECALCHDVHGGEGPVMLTEIPNTTTINPSTGKPFKRTGTLCLACHAPEPDGTGYKIIHLEHSHPIGVKPKRATLPPESKGFIGEEEDLTCRSCHDQHPSNTNYKYIRWKIETKEDIVNFCSRCHPYYRKRLEEKILTINQTKVGIHFNKFENLDGYLKFLDKIDRNQGAVIPRDSGLK
ncbi:MAG: cytochrome c3 family protein, partial [bacterium]